MPVRGMKTPQTRKPPEETSVFPWPLAATPRLLCAVRASAQPETFAFDYRIETHALHLYDYAGRIRLGDREYAFAPGDFTLTPAGVEVRYAVPKGGFHDCVHFWPADDTAGECAAVPMFGHLAAWWPEGAGQVRGILELFAKAPRHAWAVAAAATSLQAVLLNLALRMPATDLVSLDSVVPASDSDLHSDHAVREAAAILAREMHAPPSPRQLARRVGLNPNYLARRFRQAYGRTLQGYLRRWRIMHAGWLLRESNLPVKEVGVRVGIPDPQHFNKLFRREEGMSPGAFRRQA